MQALPEVALRNSPGHPPRCARQAPGGLAASLLDKRPGLHLELTYVKVDHDTQAQSEGDPPRSSSNAWVVAASPGCVQPLTKLALPTHRAGILLCGRLILRLFHWRAPLPPRRQGQQDGRRGSALVSRVG